jgi:pyruvate carboxylase
VDFDAEFVAFQQEFDHEQNILDFLSYKMYPDVFRDFYEHRQKFGDVDYLPTPTFFYGLGQGDEILVKLQRGKTISIRFVYRSKTDENGRCKVTFELNGQTRSVQMRDVSVASTTAVHRKAVEDNEIGSPLMGKLASVQIKPGDAVQKDTPLFIIEAMKMESTITAPVDGKVKAVHLEAGTLVEQGDLVVELEYQK